jgi:hypothetical protein
LQLLGPEAVVRECLRVIDSGHVSGALEAFMAEDCRYQFANAPAVFGRRAVADVIDEVMRRVDRLEHAVVSCWAVERRQDFTIVVCELEVSYWMKSGAKLSCPGCIVAHVSGEARIVDQRNYGDLSPVFSDAAAWEERRSTEPMA